MSEIAIFVSGALTVRGNRRMVIQRIVPGATIVEPKKKAADCEEKAKQAAEPEASRLRAEALLCQEWIAALRSALRHS